MIDHVHPALARALDKRGYETLTPVQSAVVEPGIQESDLIVSAQTGSGKTVAFGLTLAHTLLALLDWLPVRMVALAFALAGDFVAGFNRLRARLFEPLDAEQGLDLLDECARRAMSSSGLVDRDSEFALRAAAELTEMRALLQRTQIVWVAVLALIVLVV